MHDFYNLQRFVAAQGPNHRFDKVLAELRNGRKKTHWMWFVFPQISGLGRSEMARFYAITCLEEAQAYLQHPLLGQRLELCAQIIEPQVQRTARQIFGSPDDMKLHSSMTLFAVADPQRSIFQNVLDTFFDGVPDPSTLDRLNA
ncbi:MULTISPECIES: DUF1810 domain-containing protein [Pseudomonas]|jgi:uncharacterized protein (DUF1810 family)|uniref:Calpastatin n=1 Tax=Pseudomonas syringae TaxID=317 RepID=A0A085V812_PSESX|nr:MULTISPECIES: DUF1810 domain-containing protein [Pseudomonas]EPJ85074.1 hypothetical protein CFII64_12853 [Pseudomonas sp. CFII64]KFE51575.1 calpastatin [Pseudomonas syringae]